MSHNLESDSGLESDDEVLPELVLQDSQPQDLVRQDSIEADQPHASTVQLEQSDNKAQALSLAIYRGEQSSAPP